MTEHQLSHQWILWYHSVNDNKWTEDSYRKLCELNSLEDMWKLMNTISTFTSGMFFLMREDIFPRWEDINNIDGGYWSFRVTKKNTDDAWQNLIATLISNNLMKDINNMPLINGISLSPKINNCIIKIWSNDFTKNDIKLLNGNIAGINTSDSFYRKHQDQSDFNKKN